MNSNTAVNPRNPQHIVRNELGQFASVITTPATLVNQALVNQNLAHWKWLYVHGYTDVQPNEIFAGTGK